MKYSEKWVCQSNWNENIAAVLTSFCRIHDIQISRREIYKEHVGGKTMANFDEISRFCDRWGMEHLQLEFVEQHLDSQFLPAFVLMEGYRTALVMYVEDSIVHFIDGMRGWMELPKKEFYEQSMRHIVLVDFESYTIDPDFEKNEKAHTDKVAQAKKDFELSIVPDFLSSEECDRLIKMGKPHYQRSTVVTADSKEGSRESDVRTSSSAYLMFKDTFLDKIRKRGADLLGIDYTRFEQVQLTSYTKGQQYEIHSDAFDLVNSHEKDQRTHTILVYLKDDFEGGATLFPVIETSVKAKKGTAVVWRSLDDNGVIDPRGFHGGLPVRSGRKTICNLWIRNKPQSCWNAEE